MSKIFFILSLSLTVVFVLNVVTVQGVENSTQIIKKISIDDSNVTLSDDPDRKLSKRHTIHIASGFEGKSPFRYGKRGRPARNKRPRSQNLRRPHNSVGHHDHEAHDDYYNEGSKKHLYDDRRNRYGVKKERLKEFYENYFTPDLDKFKNVFNNEEIRELFLTTDFDYNKLVRDYNAKLINSQFKIPLRYGGKYGIEGIRDSEGAYDFSESSNPDSNEDEAFFHKHYSKYKKTDASQQLSPVAKYDLDNLKDFGIKQNSYGEYPNPPSIAQANNYDDYKPYKSDVKSKKIQDFDDLNYNLELVKTTNKTRNPFRFESTKTNSNYAPSNKNYASDYKFDTKFGDSLKGTTYSTSVPILTTNYGTQYDFDAKLIHDILPTKYSISDWNANVKNGGEFSSHKYPHSFEGDLSNQNNDYSVDVVKQFYELNKIPAYATVPVTAKPLSYDLNAASTTFQQNTKETWKEDNGWKVIEPGSSGVTQIPDVYQPIIVPVPQPYPVRVPIAKPVAVPIVKEIKIPVEKEVPYAVIKNVPYPVEKPVPVKVEKQVTVAVSKPYPVKIPIIKNIYHHAHDAPSHIDDWDSESAHDQRHEFWTEDSNEYDIEEETEKDNKRHSWRNERPKYNKRKNKDNEREHRPKKRNPPGLPRRQPGKSRVNKNNVRNNNNRNQSNNRRKNSNSNRLKNISKRLSVTRHVEEE